MPNLVSSNINCPGNNNYFTISHYFCYQWWI